MSDDLETKTDAELNNLFAVEVAGWIPKSHGLLWDAVGSRSHIIADGVLHRKRTQMGLPTDKPFLVDFCTDANAVLPWLEKYGVTHYYTASRGHIVMLYLHGTDKNGTPSSSCAGYYMEPNPPTTFARATVIALLRAKRAQA